MKNGIYKSNIQDNLKQKKNQQQKMMKFIKENYMKNYRMMIEVKKSFFFCK
jgi:hypothetical protein